jgi:hypothetical protein
MKHISTTMRAFMLFMTVLLLITSTVGRSLATSVKKNVKKPVTEQKKPTKAPKKTPILVQAVAFEAVVTPALAFDFTQDFYFLALPLFFEIPNVSLPKHFEVFYYFFSFFRNVFGHHIAINAP